MADRLYISSHQRCSVKKGVLKNFTKFTGKHLARPSTLLNKRLQHRCFPKNFVKLSRTTFIQNTSGRLLLPVLLDRWLRFYPSNKNNPKWRFYPRKHSYRKRKKLPKKDLRFLKVNCWAVYKSSHTTILHRFEVYFRVLNNPERYSTACSRGNSRWGVGVPVFIENIRGVFRIQSNIYNVAFLQE